MSLRPKNQCYLNSNLSKLFKLISPVQSYIKKYSASSFPQIRCFLYPSRLDQRGASRSSRHAGRDAMDAMRHETNDVVADGEVVWSWRPDAGAKFAKTLPRLASDGGKRARSPGRARRKPLKPLRRECRLFPVNLWLLTRVLFYAHAAAGASDTRHSLRPLISLRVVCLNNSGISCREDEDPCQQSYRGPSFETRPGGRSSG